MNSLQRAESALVQAVNALDDLRDDVIEENVSIACSVNVMLEQVEEALRQVQSLREESRNADAD